MSTETVAKPATATESAAHKRWFAIVDEHLPSLFIGVYVLVMSVLIVALMATGRLRG